MYTLHMNIIEQKLVFQLGLSYFKLLLNMKGTYMGGSFGGTFIESTSTSFNCKNIHIITSVASPDPVILKKIRVGFFLTPELIDEEILVVKYKGDVLGGIVLGQIQSLIKCIKKGTKIKVEVLSITGGDCTI